MAIVISAVKEIDNLRFTPFPSRPTPMKKLIRIDGQLVGVGENGTLYADGALAKNHAYGIAEWGWLPSLLRALIKLGVVKPEVAKEHQEICRRRDRQREAASVIEYDIPRLEKLGVKLTNSQLQKLRKAAKK